VHPIRSPYYLIWRYSDADWEKVCALIEAFVTSDAYWLRWCELFLGIMEECIPRVTISARNNLTWLSKAIENAMRRRDTLSGYSPKFRSARNKHAS